jgi:hypothetical protein
MRKLLLFTLFWCSQGFSSECKLYYTSQKQVQELKSHDQDIASLSSSVNEVLKASFNILNKIDHATLGLASLIATNGRGSFEDFKPSEWDKLNLVGNLIYQESAFVGVPLKGVKLTFSENENARTITTGAYGEFSENFSKIVPYSRLRLFPLIWEMREKSVPSVKVPIKVKLESKVCNAETTIQSVPIGQLVLIATHKGS